MKRRIFLKYILGSSGLMYLCPAMVSINNAAPVSMPSDLELIQHLKNSSEFITYFPPAGLAIVSHNRHCEEQSDEAIQSSSFLFRSKQPGQTGGQTPPCESDLCQSS